LPGPTGVDEWTDAIIGLLGVSAGERRRLGEGARAIVRQEYSYDAWKGRWREALGLPM
jgi:hypothetical protein